MSDQETDPAQSSVPRERVEESSFYRDIVVQEPTWRERTASNVAYVIVGLFGLSLLLSLFLGYTIVTAHPGNPPDERVVDVSLAYFKAVGSVFTPLLGFILGYYFTRKEE